MAAPLWRPAPRWLTRASRPTAGRSSGAKVEAKAPPAPLPLVQRAAAPLHERPVRVQPLQVAHGRRGHPAQLVVRRAQPRGAARDLAPPGPQLEPRRQRPGQAGLRYQLLTPPDVDAQLFGELTVQRLLRGLTGLHLAAR